MISVSAPARACLWEKDTLQTEAKGVPTAIKAISGRFERNPPLYYEMRFERVSAKIPKTPRDFSLYDDAAVAQSRLGKPAEALKWIEKKRAVLSALNAQNKEDWYRYYANAATFSMQKWLVEGANKRNKSDLKTARDQIKRALEINPDAHFGRERYQLGYIEWLLNPNIDKQTTSPLFWDILSKPENAVKAVGGISGLVTEGLGWENVDVFRALGAALTMDIRGMGKEYGGKSVTGFLSFLRAEELVKRGGQSLDFKFTPKGSKNIAREFSSSVNLLEHAGDHLGSSMVESVVEPELRATFQKLRADADAYHVARTDFMLPKLRAGEHPDTNADFWNGYSETAAPHFIANELDYRAGFSPALLALLLPLGASYWVLKRRESAQ